MNMYIVFSNIWGLKAVNCKAKIIPRNQVLKMNFRDLMAFWSPGE